MKDIFQDLMEGGSYSSGLFEAYACHSLGDQMLLRLALFFRSSAWAVVFLLFIRSIWVP